MINVEKIASDMGYWYIEAGYGKWQDGGGIVKSLKSMSNEYLENCSNFVGRGIAEIENGQVDKIIKQEIKKQGIDNVTEELLDTVKMDMINILKNKKDEIDELI